MKQKNKTKQMHKRRNVEFMVDLEKWEFLETQGNLAFYVTALLEYVHLRFLKIFFLMLLS